MTEVRLMDVLHQIEREKGIPVEALVGALEAALASAYRKHFGATSSIRVELDPRTSDFHVYAQRVVVQEPRSPATEIGLEEARRLRPDVRLGDTLEIEVTPEDFGRIAAQTAKQVILQKIREAERDSIYQEFAEQEGQVVSGTIQRFEGRKVYVDLGRVEGLLMEQEQVRGERYPPGARMRFYVLKVRKTTRQPEILLSRSHPGLLRRLLEAEVPEIYEGIVEIKSVAREAGSRSKVAVASRDPHVDPVGACVGHRGSRIQAVMDELNGERIDIIRWHEDPERYITEALSPARVKRVIIEDPHKRIAVVLVSNEQQSLAIGRSGQNVRLAARLTNWRIDIRNEAEWEATRRGAAKASE